MQRIFVKQSEINLLTSFVKHCERVLTQSPPPSTRDTKTYNAYRIARYKELGKVKRIIAHGQLDTGKD